MRWSNWKTVSTLVTTIAIVGCQESTVLAPENAPLAPTSYLNAPAGRPVIDLGTSSATNSDSKSSGNSGKLTATFTVTPAGGVFFIGNNAVYFPRNAICDPNTANYGVNYWDAPCTPTKSNITFTATVKSAKLGTWIDFSRNVRFVPSNDPSQWVWLYMGNANVVGARDFSAFNMTYAVKMGDAGFDESASDATLRTYVDPSGSTFRRVKHFSGFHTSSGRSCDPNQEDDCYPDDGGGSIGGAQ